MMTAISLALCAISVVLLLTRGLNYGPDFAGGALVQVRFDAPTAAGDVRAQTQQCIDNIRALIEEAGGTLDDVVKCTVYVTDRAYWQAMNEVYFANFKENPPHRVSCIVSGLGAPECLVEIDATAYLGE